MRGGLLQGPAGFEPAHYVQPPEIAAGRAIGAENRGGTQRKGYVENMADLETGKGGARYAEDGEGVRIQVDRFSDHRGISAVLALPEGIAKDRAGGSTAGLIVHGGEERAQGGRHAQNIEDVAARPERFGGADLSSVGEVEPVGREGKEAGERLLPLTD